MPKILPNGSPLRALAAFLLLSLPAMARAQHDVPDLSTLSLENLSVAVARAAATPSRIDSEIVVNTLISNTNGNLILSRFVGSLHLPAETLMAYEAGLRIAPLPKLSFDLATFINHYGNLHTNEPGTPYFDTSTGLFPPHLVIPVSVQSNGFGQSRGLELLVNAHPLSFWKLSASYTAALIEIGRNQFSQDFDSPGDTASSTPSNQFQLHSFVDLPHRFELDSVLYFVSGIQTGAIAPYTRLDLRAGWRPTSSLELSLGGANLLQSSHLEFLTNELVASAPVSRSAFVKAIWRFR